MTTGPSDEQGAARAPGSRRDAAERLGSSDLAGGFDGYGQMETAPPGSYLAISHLSSDIAPSARAEAHARLRQLMHEKQTLRSHEEVASFFAELEMVDPGLVRVPEWRPDNEADAKSPSALWGGVGRKVHGS